MTAVQAEINPGITEKEYKRRIWAWTMYDWANSAFATSILAAVLPVFFSDVAGATLPSAARATAIWNLGGSVSFLIIALLSPILGTVADIMRGKKRFLAIFAGIGIVGTALLFLVSTGDWLMASILAVVGRIGFNGSITFYDALLPHVARPDDRDRVSARGYAIGYLGGGILLVVNVVMLQIWGFTLGSQLSFLSVALWWAVFTIPVMRTIPEPPAVTSVDHAGGVISSSFKRLWGTLKDIRRHRELFKFLVAFFIYNDGIGTIIFTAAIYGAELGFSSLELVLAILLVQFVGIPYSLIFGRLPTRSDHRRAVYLAFVLYNLVALPLVARTAAAVLPGDVTGAAVARYENTPTASGEGIYLADSPSITYLGTWTPVTVAARDLDADADASYFLADEAAARVDFIFNGQEVKLTHSQGNDHGIWAVHLDGQPYIDPETNAALLIDGYNPTPKFDGILTVHAAAPGEHQLSLVNTGEKDAQSQGTALALGKLEVLPGIRHSNLGIILGLMLVVQLVGLGLAFLVGKPLFGKLADRLDTKRSVLLALLIYAVVAIWGFFLNTSVEFWYLAWMVSVVQGGSQALSRSLYSAMSPASKSGEFFGLFGIMEKFSSILGPLVFAWAAVAFNSSRPAVLSLVVFFILGGWILNSVNVPKGIATAQEEDARAVAAGLVH